MPSVTIHIPEEIEALAPDIEYFVSTMVRKLHCNRHKGVSANLSPGRMLVLLEGELEEACSALYTQGQFEFAVECVDVANFALLAARGAWQMTRQEYEDAKGEENGNA